MKVALGTVTVTDYEREAIAWFYGEPGKASRETVKHVFTSLGSTWVADDLLPDYEEHLDTLKQEGC